MDTPNISSTLKDSKVLKDRDCDHTSIGQVELKTNLFFQKIFIMARHSTVIMNMVNIFLISWFHILKGIERWRLRTDINRQINKFTR